jgi:hypothetical protein
MKRLWVPKGTLKSQNDDAAAIRRKKLRYKLLQGEEVKVKPNGNLVNADRDNREEGIVVPEGKLASFYWYERDRLLFEGEKKAMGRFFPQFKLDKLEDGRLYWHGVLETDLRKGGKWYLQAIYDNNHPHNSSYGGSVKVYAIEPDLQEIQDELEENIPHLLEDSGGNIYLCTARKEDVRAGKVTTSAASSLSWAAKWIAAFELWMTGDISTSEFAGHQI